MREKFLKFKHYFLEFIKRLIKNHKYYIVLFVVLFLISIITGIITCAKFADDLTCENLINIYLYSFLKKDYTFFSLFLILSVFFIIICFFTIFLIKNRFLLFFAILLFVLGAYIFGFDLCVVILCLGLSGIILGIIFWGIGGILLFLSYIMLFSIVIKNNFSKNCAGCYERNSYKKLCFLLVLVGLIILFFMCFFFSIIHIFVIID